MTGCYAKGCRNSSSYGLKMNFFPRDPDRRTKWIENCKKFCAITYRLPNDHSALCEYHFEPHMWEKLRVDGTKKLKCSAVPTIFGDKIPQVWKEVVEYSDRMKREGKNILEPANTNSSGFQIVALPMTGNQYKILLPVSQNIPGKMDNFQIQAIRDVTLNNETPSTVKVNSKLLLNNNGVAHFIASSPSTATFQNSTPTVQQSTKDITSDKQVDEKKAEEEDDDLDSFIASNFEPVSDEEMNVDDNFEPVPDELIGSYEKDDVQVKNDLQLKDDVQAKEVVQVKEVNIPNPITAAEIELYSLQTELLSTAHITDKKCSRCERTEKVYEKSEKIRIMMKKKFKQRQRDVRKIIESLEAKISSLEENQRCLSKLFNREQMSYLLGEKKRVPKWSDSTLEKAYQCLLACGPKGYKFLLDQHYPLPCIKILQKNKNKIPIPHQNTIEYH